MRRRLVAILAADVVGYSAMMGADEVGALERLRACEAEVIEPAVAAHGGRIFKRMGDGYLVEFASVVSAVECAMDWLAGASGPIRFRIGIHLGDVIVEGDDLFGDGVNIAARLEPLADSGGLCLSEDAQRQLRGKLDLPLEDMGETALKNIAAPIRVFRLGGSAPKAEKPAAWDQWDPPRILLAQFRQHGGDAPGVAEGVTESVAEALSAFEAFTLIDPGQAARLIAAEGVAEAGRRLHAAYVLDGSVQASGAQARVRVQLIDAAAGRRVWSGSFDRSAEDVFVLQDDIAAFVGSTVGEAVEAELARAIDDKPDVALTPFESYARALEHLHRLNPRDNAVARRMLEGLLARGVDNYRIRMVLGWTYVIELAHGWPRSREDSLEFCFDLIGEALRTHDRSPGLHRLMARLFSAAGDPVKAYAHSARARELNPYDSDILFNHGFAEAQAGRVEEAVALIERALAINPYAPTFYRGGLSLVYFLAGRPEEGIACLSAVEGVVGQSRIGRILNLTALGRTGEAEAEACALLSDDPSFTVTRYASGIQYGDDAAKGKIAGALRAAGLPE